jgi:predicted nucleic-acid-binding protein
MRIMAKEVHGEDYRVTEHYWVDTNVILRYITLSPDEQAESAIRLMNAVDEGKIILHIHPLVIAECCYVLQGKMYNLAHVPIAQILQDLILSEGIEAEEEETVLKALDFYGKYEIDFEDAYLSAYAETHSCRQLVTFNKKDYKHMGAACYSPKEALRDI